MAYDIKKIYKQAISAIEADQDVVFLEDLYQILPCSHQTFKTHFPSESAELATIKELLEVNKTKRKKGLRKKWYDSDTAPLQLALYKLMANPDEIRALSMTHTEHSGTLSHEAVVKIVNAPNGS